MGAASPDVPTVPPVPPPPSPDTVLAARALTKHYVLGDVVVQALRGVDLVVARGEMVAIMGPSGSGKTTLLNCLSGLDSIDEGEVLIEGVSLASKSDRQRTDYRARRMGFVFQFYNLMPVLTAVENVELPLLVARVQAKEARRRAIEALALVGLEERAEHVPDELSGGTFTVTNTGSRGALFDTPVVFLPQSAILGTGIVTKRPGVVKVDGQEAIAIRSYVYLALSYDHRTIDGADASRFLVAIKNRLEEAAFTADLGI